MDKPALIDALRRKTKYTKREIGRFLEAFADVMQDELAGGGDIWISGIGRFVTKKFGPWKGRHPVTGEPLDVPSRWKVRLVPCKELRDRVEFSPKLFKEEGNLLERYGIKEVSNGEVRSGDRPEEGREGKARQRFPWSR